MGTFECIGCFPELICHDISAGIGKCCNNFLDVVEFAKLLVHRLELSIPSNQSYSVVGFATDATFATHATMTSSSTALHKLDVLRYSGGRTNHAAAMIACHKSLLSPFGKKERESFVLLITDSGNPSEPRGSGRDPRIDAQKAATEAKADGMFVIPVMIVPQKVMSAELTLETTSYLQNLSSDGSVLEVSDFGMLGSLEDSLLAQVSCEV